MNYFLQGFAYMSNIALLIAGGVGARMNSAIPKQFITVYDKPIIVYTLEKFQNHPAIDEICVVCLDGWEHVLKSYAKQYNITKLSHVTTGGMTGQESIKNGLDLLNKYYTEDSVVLIHDAIRPNISADIISNCISTINTKGSCVVVIPCNEAMLVSSDMECSSESYPRDLLKRTQTPQGASLRTLLNLHQKALTRGITNSVATCTLMVEVGDQIFFSPGSEKNIKLTSPDDIDIFKALLRLDSK